MGTFHQGKHALHGITVVVDTTGAEVWVGRCDDITEQGVILLDADVHRDGDDGHSKGEWVERAARFGVWPRHRRQVLTGDVVTSVRPLGEVG
ncbi:MAG TPA: hypothetical protein VHQ65_05955 [Thermoanaerobaculia bacterium]|nr:hypothetical protein [Thermoanaerobaculia bacterium]